MALDAATGLCKVFSAALVRMFPQRKHALPRIRTELAGPGNQSPFALFLLIHILCCPIIMNPIVKNPSFVWPEVGLIIFVFYWTLWAKLAAGKKKYKDFKSIVVQGEILDVDRKKGKLTILFESIQEIKTVDIGFIFQRKIVKRTVPPRARVLLSSEFEKNEGF